MKKTYTKPEIAFESFGVSSNFATTVSTTCFCPPSNFSNDCGVIISGRKIFLAEIEGCEYVSQDGDFDICYYVPTGDTNVFNS